MEIEIVNKFSDSICLSQPVCLKPFTKEKLLELLRKGVDSLALNPRGRYKFLTAVGIFEKSIQSLNRDSIYPDESLLQSFREDAFTRVKKRDGKSYSQQSLKRAVDDIREILNKSLYPEKHILRKIIPSRIFNKYQRFLGLSDISQKLIVKFESDGRCLNIIKKVFHDTKSGKEAPRLLVDLKTKKLSDLNRKSYIDKVMAMLSALGINAIETIGRDELETLLKMYRSKGKEDTARAYLAALYSLIGNGIGLGLLKQNPFDNFPLEKRLHKSREDFIMPDQMDKILDLKAVNLNNIDDVKKRLVTVLLYDTGLRATTLAQIRLQDVIGFPDGRFEINVRGLSLKGNKGDKTLHILFQATMPLLRAWIHSLRKKLQAKSDRLFISKRGGAFTKSGIRNLVRECCIDLNVKTVKGKIPSPHTLRHTLATLNTEPFGKSLSPRLMQQRLVHLDLETLERNYVHNNPLAVMKEYKKLLNKERETAVFDRISKEDLWSFLDSLKTVKPSSIADIKKAYERECSMDSDMRSPSEDGRLVTETQAMSMLKSFHIDARSLRQWGIRNGHCLISQEQGAQKSLYKEEALINLLKNYLPVEEALNKYEGGRTVFYERLKKCLVVKIGRKSFIAKDDFLERFLRNDYDHQRKRSVIKEPDAPYSYQSFARRAA